MNLQRSRPSAARVRGTYKRSEQCQSITSLSERSARKSHLVARSLLIAHRSEPLSLSRLGFRIIMAKKAGRVQSAKPRAKGNGKVKGNGKGKGKGKASGVTKATGKHHAKDEYVSKMVRAGRGVSLVIPTINRKTGFGIPEKSKRTTCRMCGKRAVKGYDGVCGMECFMRRRMRARNAADAQKPFKYY